MIFISQGHEHSIALEILFKSVIQLSQEECNQLTLIATKNHLLDNISSSSLAIRLEESFIHINDSKLPTLYCDESDLPSSCSTLKLALQKIKSDRDILLTLPTSKDQLPLNGEFAAGYTEFFRKFFDKKSITMAFKSSRDTIALMSDHISLSSVSEFLTSDMIEAKLRNTIVGMNRYFNSIDDVIIAGINPHAGEGGLLGEEDSRIVEALHKICPDYPALKFYGPLSADTLHILRDPNRKQLFVYMYHDQGLTVFKDRNGFEGVNISFGLPFLRMSVDHGTAFELYGQDAADPQGCLYMLKEALRIQGRL